MIPEQRLGVEAAPSFVAERPAWQHRAACAGAGPARWFPDDDLDVNEQLEREAAAKRVCAGCTVVWSCRLYGLEAPPFGVWGGLTANELRERYALPSAADPEAEAA